MGTLLAPAGAAVMTRGITIASAGTAARRVMAERSMALVIAYSRKDAGAVADRRGRSSNRSDLASHIPSFQDRHATGPGQQTLEVPKVTCSGTKRARRHAPGDVRRGMRCAEWHSEHQTQSTVGPVRGRHRREE